VSANVFSLASAMHSCTYSFNGQVAPQPVQPSASRNISMARRRNVKATWRPESWPDENRPGSAGSTVCGWRLFSYGCGGGAGRRKWLASVRRQCIAEEISGGGNTMTSAIQCQPIISLLNGNQ